MIDSARLVWVESMCRRWNSLEVMTTLMNMKFNTSEQHVKLTSSCQQRHMKSMEKIILWFDTQNPFNPRIEALQSLFTGITSSDDDNINCNGAEMVTLQIQSKLDKLAWRRY